MVRSKAAERLWIEPSEAQRALLHDAERAILRLEVNGRLRWAHAAVLHLRGRDVAPLRGTLPASALPWPEAVTGRARAPSVADAARRPSGRPLEVPRQ